MPNPHILDKKRLIDLKDRVFDNWVAQVRCTVPYAEKISEPVLTDTLPAFYDHLVRLVCAEVSTYDRSTIASEHGAERARLTQFNAESIIYELQLFRASVFFVWKQDGVCLVDSQIKIVLDATDEALRNSVSGFILMETMLREQFFSAVAHDLRTPLGTAMMAVKMIRNTDNIEQVNHLVNVASKQHELMSRMISDLLHMMVLKDVKSESLNFEELDLQVIVEQIVEDARLSTGRSISLQADNISGFWDQQAMRRATENLLNNAVKYSWDNSPIEISLKSYRGRAILIVCNLGEPIPADRLETIFQLFRRAEKWKKHGPEGWGIGLPYVRNVAERHAGSISVESSDSTTRFILDVPIDPRPILDATQNQASKES